MTRSDFIIEIEKLLKDIMENKSEYENLKTIDFLDALSRYTREIDGYYKNLNIELNPEKASWSNFINMIKGAAVYE